jgi:hypothetical protein
MLTESKTCSNCGLDKLLECYSIQKRGRLGLSPTCKVCASARNKNNRKRNRDRIKVDIPAVKLCPICKKEKDKGEFLLFPANKDGLYFVCNSCDKTRGNVRRRNNADRKNIDIPKVKKCADCKVEKPNHLFGKDRCTESGLASQCKSCSKNRMLLWNYGVGLEWFDKLLESQGGRCALCGTDTPGGQGGFHVDHDHLTGKNRELLCHGCNVMLGFAKDSTEILQKAIDYLNKHKEAQ